MPPGVTADHVQFRQADFIETSIGNVQKVLLEAVAVVAIVLFLFLLNVRTTVISLTAIPLSVLITVVVFQLLGLSINTMTLGGLAIAIGELVDDAVVDVENIFRRLRENRRGRQPAARHRRGRAGEPGGPLRHRLRDDDRRSWSSCRCSRCPASRDGCSRRSASPTSSRSWRRLIVSITVTPVLCYYLLPRMKRMDARRQLRWCAC